MMDEMMRSPRESERAGFTRASKESGGMGEQGEVVRTLVKLSGYKRADRRAAIKLHLKILRGAAFAR